MPDDQGEAEVPEPAVRGQRSRGRARRRPLRVVVTAAAGPVGRALAEALRDDGARVVAVDVERGAAEGVEWRVGDPSGPDVVRHLSGADAVVHPAVECDLRSALQVRPAVRRAAAVRAVQAVVTGAAAAGVPRALVVTSAAVHGAREDNPLPLQEEAPLRAVADDGLVGDLLAVEEVLAAAARVHPGLEVVPVRPASLVGPGVDTVVTRHFEAPRLLSVRDATPTWQFCHLDDLGAAVALAVRERLPGPLCVASDGWLDQAEVEQRSGMRRVEVPARLASTTAERLHRVGVLPMPAGDLAYVLHPWAVSADRLAAAGWRPGRTNAECLAELLEAVRGHHAVAARRLERRDAALGAAGAAVAVVGTAAVLRRTRRRRPG